MNEVVVDCAPQSWRMVTYSSRLSPLYLFAVITHFLPNKQRHHNTLRRCDRHLTLKKSEITIMAEPQPAGIQEGDQAPSSVPTSAEDRKAAAALSNLDASGDNETTIKQSDPEALGKAMKGLSVSSGNAGGVQASKKVVKVDAADVALLVSRARIAQAYRGRDLTNAFSPSNWTFPS